MEEWRWVGYDWCERRRAGMDAGCSGDVVKVLWAEWADGRHG